MKVCPKCTSFNTNEAEKCWACEYNFKKGGQHVKVATTYLGFMAMPSVRVL